MYSMVLMMALSTGASTPATHHGCYGGCYGSHGGYSCGGCQGYSGHGCWGSKWSHGCQGCQGYSHSCGGCGGCHGLLGGLFSCFKGNHGCYGSSYQCHGCYGCHGCHGCYGGACYGQAAPPAPGLPKGEKPGAAPAKPGTAPAPKVEGKEEVSVPTPARLLVTLPAEAKLTIDNVATTSTSSSRLFVTPELAPGRDYIYTLKAEITRNGKTETVAKQVTVRAGRTTETVLDLPVATASR